MNIERGSAVASIVVAGSEVGFVVVPLAAPPVFVAIRELGPTLTWVGLALLAIGAASAALLIFGPAHRRLRTLEQAARALGQGRTDVRAVEAPSPAVNAGLLRCEKDAEGSCVKVKPCLGVPDSDDCLAETEERAWSSPIFVEHASEPPVFEISSRAGEAPPFEGSSLGGEAPAFEVSSLGGEQ